MKICMLVYTIYDYDHRVVRYAETLVKQGYNVDVIALLFENLPRFNTINGVRVYRIQKRSFNERKGKIFYLFRLTKFLIMSTIFFTVKHLKNRYDIVHVHSVPDFEVFAAWVGKLTGAKLILDIHDIVPEFYASKFNISKESFVFKLLIFIEKVSIAFSDHVIIANHLWEKTLISRSIKKDKCSVILNYPKPSRFYKRAHTRTDQNFIILYPGTINYHQGLDIAVKAFSKIKEKIPFAELHIYGKGPEKIAIGNLINELKLNDRVFIKGLLNIDQISKVMANANLGIVPKRNDVFGNEAFSSKILEFMALGIPLLIADTKIDRFYFNDKLVTFFKSGDEVDLAEKIVFIYNNQALCDRLAKNALEYMKENNWDVKKNEYLSIIENLNKKNYNR